MNKNILLIIACLMAWVNSMSAEDKIYVTDFSITAEETKEVSVQLDNTISYVAFQFDLYLPEGITLTGYEVNGSRVPESTEVSMAKMADGSIRFIAAAMSMEEITGNSGGIVTLKLKASSEIATGNKTGSLKKVKLSKADATGFTTAEIPFAVKVLAPITVTAKSYTRTYGEGNPSLEYDVTGDMEGVPTISCEATATSPVGTYPIVVSKGSVTNYNGTYVNGTLTIEKAPLTVTAKSYTIKQGEALPTFEVTYDGFKNDETVEVLAKKAIVTCSATSTSAPDTYDIVVSGAEAGNYEVSYTKGTLTIVEADPVTVTAKSYTRKYGEANPTFEYSSEGKALDGTPTITCEAIATSPVGTYPIVVSKGSVTNFNDSYVDGVLTIEKTPLTITAQNYVIKQGEALPTFEVSFDGFKNKETNDVLTKQPTITCAATSSNVLGTYDIVVSDAEAGNYEISYVAGTLSVIDADAVVVTANSYTRKYGEANPTFEYTAAGAELEGTPAIACEATATSPVGTYPIVVSKGSVTNFNDSYVDGVLTITKASLKITAKSYTIKQGEALPTFEVTYSGFKNKETADVLTKQPTITCTATSASAPDTYTIVVSGAEADNYDISYVAGTLTITDADAIVVTAKSYTRKYGEANPIFEYTSAGATLDGTPSITCEATAASPVGTYPIVISKGEVTNYNDSYVNGTLTISKAPLSITAQSYVIKQGEALPTFEVTYDGFKNNENANKLTKQPVITCSATSSSVLGTYEIMVSGAEAENYDISYVAGTLSVVDADAVVVTAKSYSREYGEDNPAFEYTSAGVELEGTPSITCEATAASPVGTYPIVVSKGSVTNFNDSYVNGTLTISKTPLTITAQDYVIKQGDELPTFEVTYDGFKNSETKTALTKQPVITCAAKSSDVAGTYEILISGAESGNYEISYVKGTLTIEEKDEPGPTYMAGDANNDGSVNVFDVTAMVNYILGSPSGTFVFDAADVNNDETVNVFDVTKVVNIILGVDDSEAKTRKAEGASGADKLYIEDFEMEPGEELEVEILLDNPDAEYRDLQFDLYLPEGITVVEEDEEFLVDKGSRCTKKHTIGFSYTEGHYVCMLYSTAKNPLTGNSGDILTITLKADENITPGAKTGYFRNVSLSKTDATGPTYEEFPFELTVKGEEDGIEAVEANAEKPATKVLRNGGVIIIRDGKKYVPNGTPVK